MPTQNKDAKTKLHPKTYKDLMDWGETHGLPPVMSTILAFLVNKALKPHRMVEVQRSISIEGGTTEDFRDKTLHESLKRRGYFRD